MTDKPKAKGVLADLPDGGTVFFSDETIELATSWCVGSLESYITDQTDIPLGSGKRSCDLVHALFKEIMKYAQSEMDQGHPVY